MLRVVNSLVYAALAVGAASALATPLAAAVGAIVRRWSYAPGLALPWLWPALALALAAAVGDAARRIVAGERLGLRRYASLLLLCAVCVAARRLVSAPPVPGVLDALEHLAVQAEGAAARAWDAGHRYPVDAEPLQAALAEDLRRMGFRSRGGFAVATRVHVHAGAVEPELRPPEGTAPGDLVYAVDAARRRCWITAFALDSRGRVIPALDEAGRAVVLSAADGRAASRTDPYFPEYPRKSATAPGAPRRPGEAPP